MAKISIVIPVYNVENYIGQCLDSLISQSLRDIEIVCVNDGSTDSSGEIIKKYAQEDSRFKIIEQANQGPGEARNNGIRNSSGEYIMFVDPDDWVEADALEKIYNFQKENNAQVVQFDYKEYAEATGQYSYVSFSDFLRKKVHFDLPNGGSYSRKDVFEKKFKYIKLTVWSKVYKRSFILENNIKFPKNKQGEDDVFSIQVILNADKIYYIKDYLYIYRQRFNSAVHKVSDEHFCVFENIETVKKIIEQKGLYQKHEKDFSKYKLDVITRHYFNIPLESRKKYKIAAKNIMSGREYVKFLLKIMNGNTFSENIFSIKNDRKNAIKRKVVTVLGLKFKFIPKNSGSL